MPEPHKRSRKLRRVKVTTPGGTTKTAYKKRKPSRAKCAECSAALSGVPRELPSKMRNMPKSHKKPQRPYGGNLCTKCTRKKMLEKAKTSR